MTPYEERLVVELHSKWGNRWSRIARKLPGRTDNEIKNYWRTHMRKKAQEKKRTMSSPSSGSNCSSPASSNAPTDSMPVVESFSPSNNPAVDSMPVKETKERSFYDTGGDIEMWAPMAKKDKEVEESDKVYNMDDIWKDIDLLENDTIKSIQTMTSPIWNFCPDLLWMMEEEDSRMFPTMTDQFFASSTLTG